MWDHNTGIIRGQKRQTQTVRVESQIAIVRYLADTMSSSALTVNLVRCMYQVYRLRKGAFTHAWPHIVDSADIYPVEPQSRLTNEHGPHRSVCTLIDKIRIDLPAGSTPDAFIT